MYLCEGTGNTVSARSQRLRREELTLSTALRTQHREDFIVKAQIFKAPAVQGLDKDLARRKREGEDVSVCREGEKEMRASEGMLTCTPHRL